MSKIKMQKKGVKEIPYKDKKVLSFFLIMFPTIIITSMGVLIPQKGWWVMIALAFYQAVMLKQFLDNYYDPLE